MARLSYLKTSRIGPWHGIIITYNTPDQHVLKRLLIAWCIGKVCNLPSNHMSKNVIVARWTEANFKFSKLELAIINHWKPVCRPHRTINPQGQGWNTNWLYVFFMIDPAASWFEMVELPVSQLPKLDIPMSTKGLMGTNTHKQHKQHYFDKISVTLGTLINKTWISCYPHSQ